MKTFLNIFLFLFLCLGCEDDDQPANEFLPDRQVNLSLNLNLPEFSDLEFPGNSVIINRADAGINGIVVSNINGSLFTAFELTDPNHPVQACSALTVKGAIATCGCEDENSYDTTLGAPSNGSELRYGLRAYRVQLQGSNLIITN